jgi:hypothetical protein
MAGTYRKDGKVTNSKPDTAISTSILARKVNNPDESDWIKFKHIFGYLNVTRP